MLTCTCCIVPQDVLTRFAGDRKLSAELRQTSADSARVSDAFRRLRTQAGELTALAQASGAHFVELAAAPKVTVSVASR